MFFLDFAVVVNIIFGRVRCCCCSLSEREMMIAFVVPFLPNLAIDPCLLPQWATG